MSDVSFLIVYVDDVARSEAFYASILGRPAVESSKTFAMLPALVAAISVGGLLAYVVLTGIVGISAIRRLYRRHEVWVTRLSGIMFIGFAVHAVMHAVPGLMGGRKA